MRLLKSFHTPGMPEAGCDEAGRGCLAGPVFAASVILPEDYHHPLLNDSKKLTSRIREKLRTEIEKHAIAWAVAQVDNLKIDELNILRASILAMHQALDQLSVCPAHILVDGNRFFPFRNIPYTCIVKGDGIYASIAAASVLAKTWRDEYMLRLHKEFGCYAWDRNKGYPTVRHREAIARYGISAYHRRSFSLLNQQLECNF
ncbi:MAG: ribonuclease HII [Bacteroidales bacterium]|nr:ribonuclease HII [Bacteroidales bacterium]